MFETILTAFAALRSDRRGVTAVEYGLIAGIFAVAIAHAVVTVGTDLKSVFTTIGTAV